MSVLRRLFVLLLVGTLHAGAGCAGLRQQDQTAPVPPTPTKEDGGLLLKTGAIQLGPGVEQNAWRWQGDGRGG